MERKQDHSYRYLSFQLALNMILASPLVRATRISP
ncbi:hypothetical protein L916_02597 [Phytophthora nicotianae]|uniref:Uncharacterized protein n=1 Tax=Phytophthora nicotianae TaxID=4792 RepID=W2JPN2_PHYNI|nr:hypothetical protein L916_02597 [Phytophthora nicotianae]